MKLAFGRPSATSEMVRHVMVEEVPGSAEETLYKLLECAHGLPLWDPPSSNRLRLTSPVRAGESAVGSDGAGFDF